MRSFIEELKTRINQINEIPKQKSIEPLFNIHKRSLPQRTDKTVVFYVTEKEGSELLKGALKAKVRDDGTVIYYDMIRTDATLAERDVLFNSKPFVIEENL